MSCTRIVTKAQKAKSAALFARIKDLEKQLSILKDKHRRLEEKGDYSSSSDSNDDEFGISKLDLPPPPPKKKQKVVIVRDETTKGGSPLKRTKATFFKRKREEPLPLSTGSKAKKALLERFLFESEAGVSGEEEDDEYESTGESSSSSSSSFEEVDLTQPEMFDDHLGVF